LQLYQEKLENVSALTVAYRRLLMSLTFYGTVINQILTTTINFTIDTEKINNYESTD
jgi:hypothetical protein